jgi:multicomponent Na+:H+ antiporter subunit D
VNWTFWLPLIVLSSSLVTGIVIFFLPEERSGFRSFLNLAGAVIKVAGVFLMSWNMLVHGHEYQIRFTLGLGFDFLLRVDLLSLAFVSLSSNLWLVTTVYAIGYLEGSPHRSRFFGFFSLCVTASTGIALAGNLITFFIFYEFLTLVTYPLVVHRGTDAALRAGRTYLLYTITGGAVLFVAIVQITVLTGPFDFVSGGFLSAIEEQHHSLLRIVFVLLVLGFGVKAALVPLHGWLPEAMIAPAPVSALLHAVAVVKAGAYGILRVVYYVFGKDFAHDLGLLAPLAAAASATILFGSVMALKQDDLKRRLAYSTVSQVSYITLGAALLGPLAALGGLVHLIHQGIMKITLFFCAGNIADCLGLHKISELNGIGRRMPLTMGTFTVAALGMIGIPPVAGFVTKWYLCLGGLQTERLWVVGLLVASTLLNGAYFLPIIHAAWFRAPDGPWRTVRSGGRFEAPWTLLFPSLATGVFSLAAGVWAAWEWSPLGVAEKIMRGMGVLP